VLRVGDAGATRQVAEKRLVPGEVVLLRQVPGRQALRRTRDGPGIREIEPGDQPQQGRLPHAVGADDTEPPLGRDRERDIVENRVGAVVLGDAVQ
jgi:hypothetical protein